MFFSCLWYFKEPCIFLWSYLISESVTLLWEVKLMVEKLNISPMFLVMVPMKR